MMTFIERTVSIKNFELYVNNDEFFWHSSVITKDDVNCARKPENQLPLITFTANKRSISSRPMGRVIVIEIAIE